MITAVKKKTWRRHSPVKALAFFTNAHTLGGVQLFMIKESFTDALPSKIRFVRVDGERIIPLLPDF